MFGDDNYGSNGFMHEKVPAPPPPATPYEKAAPAPTKTPRGKEAHI